MLKIDNKLFERLLSEAESSPRKRAHYNIHQNYSEPVQRLCIALKKGTYVRPHFHADVNSWEMIMAIKGEVTILIFNSSGHINERIELSPNTGNIGIELQPNTWHMVFPSGSEAVIFEVKEGPFTAKKKCDFASWSPEEGNNDVQGFLNWAMNASVGEKY
ncbi:MAG: WbuC family cupin fold metalloprotein [Methylococcales bacterium]